MSRDALKDAFIAGYHACENHASSDIPSDSDILRKFDHWYTNTVDTLNRANPDFQMKAGHFYETVCGNRVGPMAWVDDNLWTSMQIGNRRNWRDDGTCIDCTEMNIVRDSTDATPDGWIEWDGSADMPPGLSGDTPVIVKCRNGGEVDDWTAGRWNWSGNGVSHQHQIIAYRRS